MRYRIETDEHELEQLADLAVKRGRIGDIELGREAAIYIDKAHRFVYPDWNLAVLYGSLLRIGYILGQRAERRRKKADKERRAVL